MVRVMVVLLLNLKDVLLQVTGGGTSGIFGVKIRVWGVGFRFSFDGLAAAGKGGSCSGILGVWF